MDDPDHKPVALRSDFWFALGLFLTALVALSLAVNEPSLMVLAERWGTVGFFFLFGLFTIIVGFPHPAFGHVSFDRVAQMASILVLGPVPGAVANGLASLVYPWLRLVRGEPAIAVLRAALMNAGLMTLVILGGGFLYVQLGGPVPLLTLQGGTLWQLLVLVVAMQLANHIGMAMYVHFHGGRPADQFNWFATGVEMGSGVIAVVVALVFNRLELPIFVVLLVVLGAGMFALKQFAVMRQKLETLVDERTLALREKTRELERQATHDELTGLFNRRYADAYLAQQFKHSENPMSFTVALADIDHFKQVNDRYSHAQGDLVLARVAHLLASHSRGVDMVARYGGEEFLLCFPGKDVAGAVELCERLRGVIEEEDWSFVASGLFITLSFGIAENVKGGDAGSLLAAADDRLYEAKYAGRNRVVA